MKKKKTIQKIIMWNRLLRSKKYGESNLIILMIRACILLVSRSTFVQYNKSRKIAIVARKYLEIMSSLVSKYSKASEIYKYVLFFTKSLI